MARSRYDDDEDENDERPWSGGRSQRGGRSPRRRRDEDDYDDDYDDGYDEPRGGPPPNYLAFSIVVLLFCCTIGGIVAVINAAQVNSKWQARDYTGARRASETAKMWCWVSFCIGLVVQPTAVVLHVLAEKGILGN
jgi:hypothetical protein